MKTAKINPKHIFPHLIFISNSLLISTVATQN